MAECIANLKLSKLQKIRGIKITELQCMRFQHKLMNAAHRSATDSERTSQLSKFQDLKDQIETSIDRLKIEDSIKSAQDLINLAQEGKRVGAPVKMENRLLAMLKDQIPKTSTPNSPTVQIPRSLSASSLILHRQNDLSVSPNRRLLSARSSSTQASSHNSTQRFAPTGPDQPTTGARNSIKRERKSDHRKRLSQQQIDALVDRLHRGIVKRN